jgi:hypothetical protein
MDEYVPLLSFILVLLGICVIAALNHWLGYKNTTDINSTDGGESLDQLDERRKKITKTLVVGQKILLESGVYCNAGTVVKVTPKGVDIQTSLLDLPDDELLHFDNEGCSYLTELELLVEDWKLKINGTYECGPWHIVALVSDEEIASWKEAGARKDGSAAQLWKEYTTKQR